MKKKLTTLLFGLLLAVGWTGSAQAQALVKYQAGKDAARTARTALNEEAGRPGAKWHSFNAMGQGQDMSRAPRQTQNYNVTSSVVHPKSWYQALDPVIWSGGSQNITEPFTDIDGMMALVKRVYTDKTIPGTKYSSPQGCDIPYQTIQYGWDILGTHYYDGVTIYLNAYTAFSEIEIVDANGDTFYDWTATSAFPSDWTVAGTRYSTNTSGLIYLQRSGYTYAYLTIPGSYLENSSGIANVRVWGRNRSSYNTAEIAIGNDTFGYSDDEPSYSTQYVYPFEWAIPGSLEPPTENGYSVLLVKLYDGINNDVNHRAQDTTVNAADLRNYFQTYIKEIQLLTDGLRVNESNDNAGTVFAYTGDLNRFFFIGKGKMAYLSSLDELPHYDRAPFYSMYEEFSPAADSDTLDYTDFYDEMKKGTTYPIVHDCNSVNFFQHYFSMSGKQGTTENRVNSLVLYIPDNRGGTSDDWRTYVTTHQPTVGMYMIDLYADVEPSATQTDYYTVTVNWFDNLDKITHSDGIPQTYKLYEIRYNEETGKNDTIPVYEGPLTEWSTDYPVGDPSYYDLHYYVIGTPTDATNKDTFFAKSNTDDVTIPGKSDFVGLQWWRYESDYVTDDGTNQEVNYYRNFLAPHALSVQGEAGINAGNVGTAGRTLTLYREQTPIINLELMMNGNKAYYRIKYINREENQQVEPGYDPNTGERNSTNN